jgi:hypothetical protein
MYKPVNSVKLTRRELEMFSVGVLIRSYIQQGFSTWAGFDMFPDVLAAMILIEESGVLDSEPLKEVRNAD